jgi:1-acyl-sn-glycerol-3-phosphate acyltransferase
MKELETATADAWEDLLAPAPEGPALGRDPFADGVEVDPFVARLERMAAAPRTRRAPRLQAVAPVPRGAPVREALPREAPARETPPPAAPAPARPAIPLRRRRAATPSLAEVELPEARGVLDRLIGEDERRRLAAIAHLVDGDTPYDRHGFSPEAIRAAFPWFHALYRWYFRVRSAGHAHVPVEGPALLVANHGGLLPFDAAMTIVDVLLHSDPPRLARTIVDRWAGSLPWINVFYARVGQVIGTRENFADLLDDGQLVLVFPEGIEGVRKPITQRYRLQAFRVGFVEQALRARAPIVPVAIVGSDDQAPILYDLAPLAKSFGVPFLPITPTFPWLGPLGLLPYPVRYRIVYGEPLRFYERFGPEGAEDARLVRYLANQVRRAVQLLLDRSRS